jgi:hypothetical protein
MYIADVFLQTCSAIQAVMRMLLADYIKLVNVSTEDVLYDEKDLNACIEKIELIDYHQVLHSNIYSELCYYIQSQYKRNYRNIVIIAVGCVICYDAMGLLLDAMSSSSSLIYAL